MSQKSGVNLFLLIIVVVAIFIATFAFDGGHENSPVTDTSERLEKIRQLNDSIKLLQQDIIRYQEEIEKIDLERQTIRELLEQILSDNEKVDSELVNGNLDFNVQFLTDFLSQEDSVGKRYRGGDN